MRFLIWWDRTVVWVACTVITSISVNIFMYTAEWSFSVTHVTFVVSWSHFVGSSGPTVWVRVASSYSLCLRWGLPCCPLSLCWLSSRFDPFQNMAYLWHFPVNTQTFLHLSASTHCGEALTEPWEKYIMSFKLKIPFDCYCMDSFVQSIFSTKGYIRVFSGL